MNNYNPPPEVEAEWLNEKQRTYDAWREAQIDAALRWVEDEPDYVERKLRFAKLEKWFSPKFAAEVQTRYWNRN